MQKMLNKIYSLGFTFPKVIISIIALVTVFFALQLDGLRWETDARVYLPKGHEGIIYDEKVDDIFGVKDTLIITIVNEEESIYNTETLKRIDRITKAITKLPGVQANSEIDIASITSSTVFEGDNQRMGAQPIIEKIPQTPDEMEALKKRIQLHKDIIVGNLVSADGSAAMIRVKIKEGAQFRYMSYFQVKALLSKEKGEEVDWGPWQSGGNWGDDKKKPDEDESWEGNQWNDGSKWKNGKRIDEAESILEKSIETKNNSNPEINLPPDFFPMLTGKTSLAPSIEIEKSVPEEKESVDVATVWEGNKWSDGSKWKDGKSVEAALSSNIVSLQQEPDQSWQAGAGVKDGQWEGNKWVAGSKWKAAEPEKITKVIDAEVWEGNQWTDGSQWKDGKHIEPELAAVTLTKHEPQEESDKSATTGGGVSGDSWQGNKWVDGNNWQDGMPVEKVAKRAELSIDWVASDFAPIEQTITPEKSNVLAGNVSAKITAAVEVASNLADPDKPMNDTFYLAGRPVIEVSSGIFAMQDMQLMVPLLIAVMALVLLIIFRTWRGMILPIMVMSISIIWTFGLMVVTDVPLYTISTMLPVILVAVGIGDGVHLISSYYDKVLENPQRDAKEIVKEATLKLGPPLFMTSITTAIGFLALMFADMPPFKIFGIFALIGILISWIVSATLLPAVLSLLKPKVGNYLQKRRSLRVYEEKNRLAFALTRSGRWINTNRKFSLIVLGILIVITTIGSTKLFVDSSWMSDFREDTEISQATKILNTKFSGSIFLNIVIEANKKDALKNPELLKKMQGLQDHIERMPYVGDTLSVVDYIKTMNKSLHAGDDAYNKIPESQQQIAEYLFLFSVSGRPQQLDEVVDFDYKTGLITASIQTDHTRDLKRIMDAVYDYVDREFTGLDVDVNLAGSGNNSYIWADLLIGSQTSAIVLSKVAILVVATLVFASILAGIYIVIPVTLSTLFVAGIAGIFEIPLDVSTALAAGIAIGVGVDYAIHYLFRYIREWEITGDHQLALDNTMRSTGHTIVLNAIVVSVGFSVLFVSQFPPHVKLGYFVTAYMIVSCLVAIWVLPALLSFFRPKFSGSIK